MASKPDKKSKAPAPKGKGKKRHWAVRILRFLLFSFFGFIGGSVLIVLVYKWAPVPGTPLMLIRKLESRDDGKSAPPVRHDWVSLEQISPHLQLAVVCSEDQNYLKHYGIDWGAVEKAQKENERRKRPRGASTISQQTSKNVFLWHGRNYFRKGLEVWFTYLIETFWSKERIMEVYLNSIEMGDGIYGAEAASQYYFGKSASRLTKEEAALIAAILPNPRRYSAKNPGGYVRGRQQHILNQMRLWGGKLDYDKYKGKPKEEPPKKSKKRK